MECEFDDFVEIDAPGESRSEVAFRNELDELKAKMHDLDTEHKKLRKDREQSEKLKQQLKKLVHESREALSKQEHVLTNLENKRSQISQLQTTIKKELGAVARVRVQLEEDRTKLKVDREKLKRHMEHFKKDSSQLDDFIGQLSMIPENNKRIKNLTTGLSKLSREASEAEKELEKFRDFRQRQQLFLEETRKEKRIIERKSKSKNELPQSEAYACKQCGTHIAIESDIESKCYQVGQGQFTEKKRGYLFKTAINFDLGDIKNETFTTGSYDISWISCTKCHTQLGWKYLQAKNTTNTSKVDKFCLARYTLTSPQDRSEN